MVLGWEVSQEAERGLGFRAYLGRAAADSPGSSRGGSDLAAQESRRPVKPAGAGDRGGRGHCSSTSPGGLVHLDSSLHSPPASRVAGGPKEPEEASVTKFNVTQPGLPHFRPHGLQPARPLCPWGCSRQEYWSELPFLPPRHLPGPGIEPASPTLQADSLPSEPPGKPVTKTRVKHQLPLATDAGRLTPQD